MNNDIFRFDLQGVPLDVALPVAFLHDTAEGWKIERNSETGVQRLVFLRWFEEKKENQKFPVKMTAEMVIPLLEAWLRDVDYGDAPDTDGSAKKGFRVYNELWSIVGHDVSAFAAVEPVWLVYGK